MEGINVSFSKPEDNADVSVLSVQGYVDTTTSAELEESLKRLLKKGRFNIVIDLSGVNYISSAGWGIFISEIKSIRENGGDLRLAAMIGDVFEVFELLEFQTILQSFDTGDQFLYLPNADHSRQTVQHQQTRLAWPSPPMGKSSDTCRLALECLS